MKCKFVTDMGVDTSSLDDASRELVRFRPVNGGRKLEAYFPAGTEFENPNAAFFVDRGCAVPADAECESAAKPLTAEQRAKRERAYRADAAGIHDPGDRELFFADVIKGYRKEGSKVVYDPGSQWGKYQAAKAAVEAEVDA